MRSIERISKHRLLAALALVGLAVPAIAVSAEKTPQIPQIRVSTRLVKVGVIGRAKNGAATNLKKGDFVLLDRGKRTPISLLLSTPNGFNRAPEQLPQNTFSDLPQYGTATPASITIVLLDNLNTLYGSAPEDQFESTPYWMEDLALENGKEQLLEFIKDLRPQDKVAIYGLTHSLHVLCDFTSDDNQLVSIVRNYNTGSKTNREIAEPGRVHSPIPDAEEDAARAELAGGANQRRAIETMAALTSIAAHVANIPGRKNLVWLTASLPLSAATMERILLPASIAAYPIDVRGLLAREAFESKQDTMDFDSVLRQGESAPAQSLQPIGDQAMQMLAADTGGRAFVNTNDLTGAIRQAVEDSEVTYTLGFYIGQDSIDGKFHPLKIEVKRKGVTLRYPKGYLAFEDTPATQDQNRDNLLAAVRSPIESSMIPVHVRIERVEKPLPHCLSILGSMDIGKLQLAENGGVRRGVASVVTIEEDQSGKVVAQSASTINFRFSDKEYANYLKTGFPFHQFVQPKADASTLRILVEDTSTAEVGSLIIPLSEVK